MLVWELAAIAYFIVAKGVSMSIQEVLSAWDKNKRFFGTTGQPEQISKIMDIIHDQEQRITELEEQVAELELLAEIEEPTKEQTKEPKPKSK